MKSTDQPLAALVESLAREHAERAARIQAECAHVMRESRESGEHAVVTPDELTTTGKILVEDLARECEKRRAALDDEARR